nr:MAG TPA: hypothetical protein [Caudoviricetes sp.]
MHLLCFLPSYAIIKNSMGLSSLPIHRKYAQILEKTHLGAL